jgi:hypothetical protein
MQLLEDMDVSGLYGNMIDILKFLIKEKNLATYKKGIPLVQTKNQQVLFIPKNID